MPTSIGQPPSTWIVVDDPQERLTLTHPQGLGFRSGRADDPHNVVVPREIPAQPLGDVGRRPLRDRVVVEQPGGDVDLLVKEGGQEP
ncbi:hypothetical protein [Pseudonocardia sp. Ae717_Ps2]|uniref:hypothetical protein n=1 Tax=Pseudonocardia sp. Ae717_Ps2 TaxID=1885573 RepID=UPI00094B4621|nr:hypothetical protein [Pseudonocardia sp. Ae717_Ps2]